MVKVLLCLTELPQSDAADALAIAPVSRTFTGGYIAPEGYFRAREEAFAVIGFLRGRIVKKQPPGLTLDVQGVGYELEASMNTFYLLPETGEEVELLTHLIVREDAHLLYAFATEDERYVFPRLDQSQRCGGKNGPGHIVRNWRR